MNWLLSITFLLTIFAFTPKAFADISCQPIYGGGQTCVSTGSISVNKTVMNPQTSKMVDNLGINDPKYAPGYIITFQISVTNTSNSAISHTDVKDTFPQFINFSTGPGSFDEALKTLSFGIENLGANETRVFNVLGRVADASNLPDAQSIVCVVNQVNAVTNQNSTTQDNAQFCIQKQVLQPAQTTTITKGGFPILSPVTVVASPSTGPESLVLFSLIPTGLAGWMLKKHSIKKEDLS